jgi:hypothetical protein
MEYFVDKDSVVRKIWGKGDTILFIFAGSAAEFALNKAVDWLYFTGRLPADPLGRLFSTVSYARKIVFLNKEDALNAIDKITKIHEAIENQRRDKIPDWAYRDVLYMLIHYSVVAYELMERRLTDEEKEDLYDVFYRMGMRMGLKELPVNYKDWLLSREQHLQNDLQRSKYTDDLYKQYKKHLGTFRYKILLEGQILIVPKRVRELLHLRSFSFLAPLLVTYKLSRLVKMDWLIKSAILPQEYKEEIKELDVAPE